MSAVFCASIKLCFGPHQSADTGSDRYRRRDTPGTCSPALLIHDRHRARLCCHHYASPWFTHSLAVTFRVFYDCAEWRNSLDTKNKIQSFARLARTAFGTSRRVGLFYSHPVGKMTLSRAGTFHNRFSFRYLLHLSKQSNKPSIV